MQQTVNNGFMLWRVFFVPVTSHGAEGVSGVSVKKGGQAGGEGNK